MAGRLDQWDALAASASEPNPFLESWFLYPALQAHADGSVEIICFEENGVLRGLLPIRTSLRYYDKPIPHVASWLHDNCFLGIPLVASGSEVAFWRALLDWADGLGGASLFLHLGKITVGGPVHAALEAVLATQQRRSEMVLLERRALLESSLSAEQYWRNSISAKKRKELRRQANRLSEIGNLAFDRTAGDSALDAWVADFLALEDRGWKGKSGSAMATALPTAQLFRAAIAGAARCGKLERLTLSLNGLPIAMLANFLSPPGAFSFKTTFDEEFARFSPGVLLQQHNLAMLDASDICWTDSCAAEDHPMIDHVWRERRAIGHLSIAIGGRLRRLLFGRIVDFETARRHERNQS